MGARNDIHAVDAHVYLGEGQHLRLSLDDLLAQMDEARIERAVVSPVDRLLAVHNREGNDLVLSAVRAYGDRLAGWATANPWFGDAAVEEVRRALGEGLSGLAINSIYQGFRLSDHVVDSILEVAADLDVPVYAHTGTAGQAEPFHVVDLALRFPSVNFIVGHAGSSDYGEDAVRALEFAPNVWLETSRNGPANFGLWQVKDCVSRVVFGSSVPEYIPAIEIQTLCDIFTESRDRQAIFRDNIHDVFKGRLGR
ncbi:MAG: amidohydrolase family protein [Candidatus Latescibacteria bacterium]|jgi:hypothetical protein|nr:amidohydrolase family protein [Candidatus Latescibacterota bacterium]